MQVTIKGDSKTGAALSSEFRGNLIISENADVTAFHMFAYGAPLVDTHVYLPGARFTVEVGG